MRKAKAPVRAEKKGKIWPSILIWFLTTGIFSFVDSAAWEPALSPPWFAILAVCVPIAYAVIFKKCSVKEAKKPAAQQQPQESLTLNNVKRIVLSVLIWLVSSAIFLIILIVAWPAEGNLILSTFPSLIMLTPVSGATYFYELVEVRTQGSRTKLSFRIKPEKDGLAAEKATGPKMQVTPCPDPPVEAVLSPAKVPLSAEPPVPETVYQASIEEVNQHRNRGVEFKPDCEIEHEKHHHAEAESAIAAHKVQCEFISIDDMRQFTGIPFEWHWVQQLNFTNGVAWFMLNKNNQGVALRYISQLNNLILDSYAYVDGLDDTCINLNDVDFDYPKLLHMDSMTNTRVECYPYTKTGCASKYPVILVFATSETRTHNGNPFCQAYPVNGEIKITQDGSIGAARVRFDLWEGEITFDFGLCGASLAVKHIYKDSEKIYEFAGFEDSPLLTQKRKMSAVLLENVQKPLSYSEINCDSKENQASDELLEEAVDAVLEAGQASVSMLQLQLKLGYARAARIVDEMEEKGIIGPFMGSKPRNILITKEQWQRIRSQAAPLR